MNITRTILLLITWTCSRAFALPDCDLNGLPTDTLNHQTRKDTLVIINANSQDSCDVGKYYASERNIGQDRVALVYTRTGFFSEWEDYRNMRDQVVRFLSDNTLVTSPNATCNTESGDRAYYCEAILEEIRNQTTVKYIVTTKNIPTRISRIEDNAPNPASVDSMLRLDLLNFCDTEDRTSPYQDCTLGDLSSRARDFGDGRGMRTVIPASDHEFVIGRIDGITSTSAMKLVDRAINAESIGIFGKLYGSRGGRGNAGTIYEPKHWIDYSKTTNRSSNYTNVYQPENVDDPVKDVWRYQHGLFGEYTVNGTSAGVTHAIDSNCYTNITATFGSPNWVSPATCVTRMTDGPDALTPGDPKSRTPDPSNALMYMAYRRGQTSTGTGAFDNLYKWRKNANEVCDATCAPDDFICKTTTEDIYKEINTQCVGVSEGFIGHNNQSFPVAYLSGWPAEWAPIKPVKNVWEDRNPNHGSLSFNLPEVIDNDGATANDNYSLHFNDAVLDTDGDGDIDAQCYTDDSLSTLLPCTQALKEFYLITQWEVPTRQVSDNSKIRFSFHFKSSAESHDVAGQLKFYVKLLLRDAETQELTIHNIGEQNILLDKIDSWKFNDEIIFDIDNALVNQYDGVKVQIYTKQKFKGSFSIDDIKVEALDAGEIIDLDIPNGSFDKGHSQSGVGDYAVNFLNRLNGTAFWGSSGHYNSGGAKTFDENLETLIYFMRGLPLGDSVWINENTGTGILYGDPLYSPLEVRLEYPDTVENFIAAGEYIIRGVARNGYNNVSQYSLDYCIGTDFFTCDVSGSWTPIPDGAAQALSNDVNDLAIFDTTDLATGDYIIRLAVLTQTVDSEKTESQVFNDYLHVRVYDETSDYDSDNLSDYDEVNNLESSPILKDTDLDDINDDVDNCPVISNSSQIDVDDDGIGDACDTSWIHVGNNYGSDRLPADIYIELQTLYVSATLDELDMNLSYSSGASINMKTINDSGQIVQQRVHFPFEYNEVSGYFEGSIKLTDTPAAVYDNGTSSMNLTVSITGRKSTGENINLSDTRKIVITTHQKHVIQDQILGPEGFQVLTNPVWLWYQPSTTNSFDVDDTLYVYAWSTILDPQKVTWKGFSLNYKCNGDSGLKNCRSELIPMQHSRIRGVYQGALTITDLQPVIRAYPAGTAKNVLTISMIGEDAEGNYYEFNDNISLVYDASGQ